MSRNYQPDFFDNLIRLLSVGLLSVVISTAASVYLLGTYSASLTILAVFVYGSIEYLGNRPGPATGLVSNRIPGPVWMVWLLVTGSAILLYGSQFGYMSMWGDIGVYLNAASHFRNGGVIPFGLEVLGFDLGRSVALEPPWGMVNPSAEEGLWQFHALPTWPAVMALSQLGSDGREVLALLYGFCGVSFLSVARSFTRETKYAITATIFFCFLPLLWHQTLYATSELLLLSIVLATTVLAIQSGLKVLHVAMGLLAYGLTHIGILFVAPIVAITLFLLAYHEDLATRRRIAMIGIFAAMAALLGLRFASATSSQYTSDIIVNLFGSHSYLATVACASPLLCCVPFLLGIKGLQLTDHTAKLVIWPIKHFRLVATALLLISGLIILYKSYLLGWTDYYLPSEHDPLKSVSARPAYVNQGWSAIAHLRLLSLAGASGILGLMSFIIFPFVKSSSSTKLFWFFTFGFVFLFAVHSIDITNNYYGSRYFLPIISPALVLLFAFTLTKIGKMVKLAPPIMLVFLYFSSALVSEGFYINQPRFFDWLNTEVAADDVVTFHGSDWLQYALFPLLIGRAQSHAKADNTQASELPNGPDILVTDTVTVLGGAGRCNEFPERAMPWTISYPRKPTITARRACLYHADERVWTSLELRSNDWIVDGEFDFLVVRPEQDVIAEIEFRSDGWWALQFLFSIDPSRLHPQLKICGSDFELTNLEPSKIAFKGVIPNRFCIAKLSTNTFIPSEHGNAADSRVLGMDIRSISISRVE